MSSKRLIVNADDLGWTRGISDGIFVAHREGIVTSASLMVNQPASEYAIRQARNYPELGVGIHLNLCEGAPVLPRHEVPTLVRADGSFYPAELATRRLWRWQISPREIEAEFRAQIRWMKSRGVLPTHADSHHHLHVYPCAAVAFRRALLAEGVHRARAPVHRHWPRNGYRGGPHGGPFWRRILVSLYMRLVQVAVFGDMRLPDCCVVHHPQFRGNLDLLGEAWRLTLESLPPGIYELGCHPGFLQRGFSEIDSIGERREVELGVLTGLVLRTAIERNHIELINYAQL